MKSGEKLRVLVLADSRAFHTGRYLAELRRQNCSVLLASYERGWAHHFKLKTCNMLGWLRHLPSLPTLRKLVQRFRPHVINPHFASGYGFVSALAGLQRLAPVLVHLWGSDILIVPHKSIPHRWKTVRALRTAAAVVGDSDFLCERAASLAPLKAAHIIPWGIERKYLALHRGNYSFREPVRVLVPRPHEAVYDNLFILSALASLINEERIAVTFPDFGNLTNKFKRQADELVGNRITYFHRMQRREFLELMAGYDIYLSNSASDSSPASMIEAMALGLIPVAADIPGVREWLGSENGYLYRQGDDEKLREIMTALVEIKDDHTEMRRRNLDRVKAQAIYENNIADTITIMRGLSSGGGP